MAEHSTTSPESTCWLKVVSWGLVRWICSRPCSEANCFASDDFSGAPKMKYQRGGTLRLASYIISYKF